MTELLRGHCFCQMVRYEIRLPIESASHCHCESCRRAHSSAFVSWGRVPVEGFNFVSGISELSTFESSPGALRQFCRKCGSHIVMRYTSESESVYFPLATLEEPNACEPSKHVSFEERLRWVNRFSELPKFQAKSPLEID